MHGPAEKLWTLFIGYLLLVVRYWLMAYESPNNIDCDSDFKFMINYDIFLLFLFTI